MSVSLPVFSDTGSLSALVLFLTSLTGCCLRVESSACHTSNYQGEGNGCFFDGSKFPQVVGGNQSQLYCLLAISGCCSWLVLLRAPTITTNTHLKPTTAASSTSWYSVLPVIVLARGINGEKLVLNFPS